LSKKLNSLDCRKKREFVTKRRRECARKRKRKPD
jgi:hypothetical protein